MSFLTEGNTFVAEQLAEHASETVTYRRGGSGGQTVSLAATRGTSEFTRQRAEDLVAQPRILDFLFNAEDLVLAASQTEPRAGDEIITSAGTFELASPGGDEPAWRWSDPDKIRIRVHTREVA